MLGLLYNSWSRPEQAVSYYRQAVDIYVVLGDLKALQAIIAGERDLALVEDEGLDYEAAAELIVFLEYLAE